MEKEDNKSKEDNKYKTFNKLHDIQILIRKESSLRELCK